MTHVCSHETTAFHHRVPQFSASSPSREKATGRASDKKKKKKISVVERLQEWPGLDGVFRTRQVVSTFAPPSQLCDVACGGLVLDLTVNQHPTDSQSRLPCLHQKKKCTVNPDIRMIPKSFPSVKKTVNQDRNSSLDMRSADWSLMSSCRRFMI